MTIFYAIGLLPWVCVCVCLCITNIAFICVLDIHNIGTRIRNVLSFFVACLIQENIIPRLAFGIVLLFICVMEIPYMLTQSIQTHTTDTLPHNNLFFSRLPPASPESNPEIIYVINPFWIFNPKTTYQRSVYRETHFVYPHTIRIIHGALERDILLTFWWAHLKFSFAKKKCY